MKKAFKCLAILLAITGSTLPIEAADVTVVTNSTEGAFPIVSDEGNCATIVYDSNDGEVVATIARAFAGDIKQVTGKDIQLATSLQGVTTPIIAGTVGKSSFIDALAAAGKINTADVDGKWEAFAVEVVDNPADGIERALVAYGANPRATAYALFEISRMMGISPYVWWADVTPEERSSLYATAGRTAVGEPSVKWRGIFINDEDWGLTPWAAKNIDKQYNNIGPNTYAKVMELLLRLRANVLWPAMHLCSEAFWANKDNLPVAKKYDVALGSSHCEQMLRDNEWEWRRYEDGSGTYDNWNYVTNKDKIQRYWEERVAESKGYSAMYTLGMRGVHDWAISGYPSTEDKVRGLTEIISFQRSLIEKHIGDPTTVPQIFIPYKEVLDAYNAGLKVPEDVILTWVDDNHGYIRQLPTATEQQRSGGHGVYYHLSYYGTPADYLWICSTPPALISYELVKGYNNGITSLWVINVGDIKPAEAELEFCMDLAWDIDKWQPDNAHTYMRQWAARTFGEEVADDIAEIKEVYYRLGQGGKPEHVFGVSYNNEEMNSRIDQYKEIVEKTEAVRGRIDPRLADAFFELIEYPVKGAYYMNVQTFRAKQSVELAQMGHSEAALKYTSEAHTAHRMIEEITRKYNTGIAGGKWDGVISWHPRDQQQFYLSQTASLSDISPYEFEGSTESFSTVDAADYTGSRGSFKEFKGLGIGKSSITVWPMDETTYTVRTYKSKAPYVDYTVPVHAGQNTIEARFVPSFPLHASSGMTVAISINNGNPVQCSLKTVATQGKWNTTVLQGFNDASVNYEAEADGEVPVRIYFFNPGIALSQIYVSHAPTKSADDVTDLLVNPDFELWKNGDKVELNTGGTLRRTIVPYGWSITGKINGESYGINNDANNLHGSNVCWINSTPFSDPFELYQTIPAEKLTPGYYLVRCLLRVEADKKTNTRLFANNYVQYYGSENDYNNILTSDEIATYANYAGNKSDDMTLHDMAVCVKIEEGEDLKLGIRTSNRLNSGGTATNNAGWFKVDNFTIIRLEGEPIANQEDLTLTKELITNYDFDLYLDGETVKENTSGETRRFTPYGWTQTGNFPGTSQGINNDGNFHGTNGCWYQAKEGVMPNDFELFQTIPAEKLTPGKYAINCLLYAQSGELGTLRLFANNNVQYYGAPIDYDKNINTDENYSFAGYVGHANNNYIMQDMHVEVDITEGEDLKFGIRSGNMLPDGSEGDERQGWFKTDFFRIHKLEGDGLENVAVNNQDATTDCGIYNLQGQRVANSEEALKWLPTGLYIMKGKKVAKK